MPTVLDWNPTVDPSDFASRLRDTLAAGSAAVLPGDSGYVALLNPAGPTAAGLLDTLSGLTDEPPAVLASGPEDAAALGLAVPLAARRLMYRGWPHRFVVALPA